MERGQKRHRQAYQAGGVCGRQPQRQGQLAATEPGFELLADGKGVSLTWQNLKEVQVNYYLMDVELLFSRSPFAQQAGSQFAFAKPHARDVVKLPNAQAKMAVPLPDELAKRNVLIEVTAAGKTRSMPYFANALDVNVVALDWKWLFIYPQYGFATVN